MHKQTIIILLLASLLPVFTSEDAIAEHIHLAVASNFKGAMTEIAGRFESNTKHQVALSFGSTGKQYAQIKHGAPFDAFFAADTRHPQLLEQDGVALPASRFTYAIGKLVLWSPKSNYIDPDGRILAQSEFRHLAIANPKLAPYGQAAQEVLMALGLWQKLAARLVRGENIAQTFQYVKSGNAELGFVAYSQVKQADGKVEGSMWRVPASMYRPIEQQAVVLQGNETIRAFMSFMKSEQALKIIHDYGYDTP